MLPSASTSTPLLVNVTRPPSPPPCRTVRKRSTRSFSSAPSARQNAVRSSSISPGPQAHVRRVPPSRGICPAGRTACIGHRWTCAARAAAPGQLAQFRPEDHIPGRPVQVHDHDVGHAARNRVAGRAVVGRVLRGASGRRDRPQLGDAVPGEPPPVWTSAVFAGLVRWRSMAITGVIPLLTVMNRSFPGTGDGSVKSPSAGARRTIVPGRISLTRCAETKPSRAALTVMVIRPSRRGGDDRENVRQCRTPPTSTPTLIHWPGRCPGHVRPGLITRVAVAGASWRTASTRPRRSVADHSGLTRPVVLRQERCREEPGRLHDPYPRSDAASR